MLDADEGMSFTSTQLGASNYYPAFIYIHSLLLVLRTLRALLQELRPQHDLHSGSF